MAETQQLTKRLTVSAILIFLFSYMTFAAPPILFVLAVEIFIWMGLWEYFNLAEKKGYVLNRYLGLIFGSLFPLAYSAPAESIIFTTAILSIFIFNFHRRLKDQALVSTSLTLFGLVYVAWFTSFLCKIKCLDHGAFWVFYAIFTTKMGDAAAYFIGKAYGKHKYIAHISPNKSIEGALGGFFVTLICSVGSNVYLPQVPPAHLWVLGIVIGILSQLGDLAESLIKRDVGVKDSGAWPGLGGVLDVLDSLLFVLPCVYYYVEVF